MFYILRREGNQFNKKECEKFLGEFPKDSVKKLSSGNYIGINNEGFRQYRQIPDLYIRSGISKYLNKTFKGPISVTEAKKLNVNVTMAMCSGFVYQKERQLYYDDERVPDELPEEEEYSTKVIAREGNIYNQRLLTELNKTMKIDLQLFRLSDGGRFVGTVNDPVTRILTFNTKELVGVPYCMLDQLYSGKVQEFEVTERNIDNILILIKSGNVIVKDNIVYLDNNKVKRDKWYDWVGRYIYGKRMIKSS